MAFAGATSGFRSFTAREDSVLRQAYSTGGIAAASVALPGRSRSALFHRAARLGVQRRARWTEADDDHLRGAWGETGLPQIARALGRTGLTVYWRAQKLGLGLGCPPELEYLSSAAIRAGFETGQLRRILRWAGVVVRRAYVRPARGRYRGTHVVDPFDVDEAIERWHRTETVQAAARRHGMLGPSLLSWLREAGVEITLVRDKDGGIYEGRMHRRIESAMADRVVAAHRDRLATTETLRQASMRAGVGQGPLGLWLIAAGLQPSRSRWHLDPATVDRVVAERRQRPSCRARSKDVLAC